MGGLVRYMTHAHRRELIEAVLALIADGKVQTLPNWLDERYSTMKELIGTFALSASTGGCL